MIKLQHAVMLNFNLEENYMDYKILVFLIKL